LVVLEIDTYGVRSDCVDVPGTGVVLGGDQGQRQESEGDFEQVQPTCLECGNKFHVFLKR
jgi:hypothetical protein